MLRLYDYLPSGNGYKVRLQIGNSNRVFAPISSYQPAGLP